jgi:hypothetical protein
MSYTTMVRVVSVSGPCFAGCGRVVFVSQSRGHNTVLCRVGGVTIPHDTTRFHPYIGRAIQSTAVMHINKKWGRYEGQVQMYCPPLEFHSKLSEGQYIWT